MPNTAVQVKNLEGALSPVEGGVHLTTTAGVAASALTTTNLDDSTRYLIVTFDGADTRIRFDGTDPTAAIGLFYADGTKVVMSVHQYRSANVIRAAGTDVEINAAQMYL